MYSVSVSEVRFVNTAMLIKLWLICSLGYVTGSVVTSAQNFFNLVPKNTTNTPVKNTKLKLSMNLKKKNQ